MRQRVAIIGTGIAGMACARALCAQFDLKVFEKNHYFGGHTNTITVEEDGREVPIDTGFMVYNEETYPNLVKLFDELDVESMETDMSFGVQNRLGNLEYACSGLDTFFAQRRNVIRPSHWKLLREILRFFKEAKYYLENDRDTNLTLRDFLDTRSFDTLFSENYLLPMTAAIWSTPPSLMLEYPAESLFRFLNNHKLLGVGIQLKWRTLKGGSRTYRDKILAPLQNQLHSESNVVSVTQKENGATVVLENGIQEDFDYVVIAAHADQALKMLHNPTSEQQRLLGAFPYSKNPVILHSDESVMPKNRRAWASWNFRIERLQDEQLSSSTHYWMNRLQNVSETKNYFVSVDYQGDIDPDKIHWNYIYDHPTFEKEGIAAQEHLPRLNEHGSVLFCGSYFKNGFHEDALASALNAANQLKERTQSHELLSV